MTDYKNLYKNCFPKVKNHILLNKGTSQDAEDIFQEALIILFKNTKKSDFILSASSSTYVFAVCRNLWLKKLNSSNLHETLSSDELDRLISTLDTSNDDSEQYMVAQKVKLVFKKMTDHCRRLIEAIFFENVPMKILMKKMGWKNKHTADNQKYKCIQQAKKI